MQHHHNNNMLVSISIAFHILYRTSSYLVHIKVNIVILGILMIVFISAYEDTTAERQEENTA